MVRSERPPVTIVIPAYQAAETIGEALESLTGQTYPDLEIIVVDDGSSDSTAEIVQQMAAKSNSRIRLLRQENAGQAAALNVGWQQASGVYLGYLGADDVLYASAVARLVQFLEAHPELVGAYPDYDLIGADSKTIRRVHAPDYDARDLVERFICQPGPGALFRRAAFEKTGGWNSSLRQMPDFDFWLRLSRYGALARIPEPLGGFRIHERSQTFTAPSASKSEEPPILMAAFLAETTAGQWNGARAMAWSHIIAARLHLRAGRLRPPLRHLKKALAYDATIIIQPRFWRLIAGGILGQLRYRLLAVTRRADDKIA
jgi:glycosyltransferase involved in cell wall biosynthesis